MQRHRVWRSWISMYSKFDSVKKKASPKEGNKASPVVGQSNHEGIVEFYNSLNRNERISFYYYTQDDAYHLDFREMDAIYFGTYDAGVAYVEALQASGPAITIRYRGQLAACWGFAQIVPGVYEAWCLGSKLFQKYPVATTRTAKFVLDYGAKYLACHRLQVTVHNENQVAKNWASVLQFQYEGLMKQFGHDKADYVMYAKYF